jgi:hypothetical protein
MREHWPERFVNWWLSRVACLPINVARGRGLAIRLAALIAFVPWLLLTFLLIAPVLLVLMAIETVLLMWDELQA